MEHWPSGKELTTTGSSTHKLLTEIQEPIANKATSPWVTAVLLHQLPNMFISKLNVIEIASLFLGNTIFLP